MKAFGFAGWSGAGKTTLIERVLPRLVAQGLRVSVIKHAHHGFDIDRPGKDSWRHREAGAGEVMLVSGRRWVLMHELREAPEPDLAGMFERLSPCDLVLVEGWKRSAIPKIEIHRSSLGKPWMHPDDPAIVAIATDDPAALAAAGASPALPRLPLDDACAIARFVIDHLDLPTSTNR